MTASADSEWFSVESYLGSGFRMQNQHSRPSFVSVGNAISTLDLHFKIAVQPVGFRY
jgi:hypothetical protein